jgi:hypothetical protein
MAVVFGVLIVASIVQGFRFGNGLLPFFTGLLGGVGAYNLHATAPAERRASLLVAAAVFVLLATVARLFLTPFPDGILVRIGPLHVLGAILVLALGAREAYQIEAIRPTHVDPHPSVWEVDEIRREEVAS